ncbi:transcription factor HES-5-like [Spinachia spinachia]
MMSVWSVRVIDPSIRQQICSLCRVTTFPDSHRALRGSLHHPPSPPPAPLRPNHCPPGIKSRGMKPAGIRSSLQRPLQHRDPHMAPTTTAAMTNSQEHLPLSHKLRKPLVEKLRRERINSSIEQLKSLLDPELLKQQPDSKLEKADILEMTVCVLRRLQQQNHPAVDSAAGGQGYSRCVQEVTHFLCEEQVKTQCQRRLLNHFNKLQSSCEKNLREADFSPLGSTLQTSISKDKRPASSASWRPW